MHASIRQIIDRCTAARQAPAWHVRASCLLRRRRCHRSAGLDSPWSTEPLGSGSRRRSRALLLGVAACASLPLIGCNTKALDSSPCGSVASVTEVQPLILSVSGSFPDTTATQLVLVITPPSGTARQFLSSSLSTTTAIIPLTANPRIASGTYPAQWMMNGCETPHQTQILGPGSLTLTN
jgi:hypothetical protein